MLSNSIRQKIENQNWVDPGMIKAAFEFWFSDNNHVRSPFPERIQEDLSIEAAHDFLDWSNRISEKIREGITDEILMEKFEEILFEKALTMVETEDEKLTLRYPFMPRLGDHIRDKDPETGNPDTRVILREYLKKGDHHFLKIISKDFVTGRESETEFELPE